MGDVVKLKVPESKFSPEEAEERNRFERYYRSTLTPNDADVWLTEKNGKYVNDVTKAAFAGWVGRGLLDLVDMGLISGEALGFHEY